MGWFRRKVTDYGGTFWSAGIEFWRIKVSVRLVHHVYPASADRWVLQPDFVYDCRESATEDADPCTGDPCICTNGIGCVTIPVEEW